MRKVKVTMMVYVPEEVQGVSAGIERAVEVGLRNEGFYLMKVTDVEVQHVIPRAESAEARPTLLSRFGVFRDNDEATEYRAHEPHEHVYMGKSSMCVCGEPQESGEKLLEGGLLCNCGQCGRLHDSDCSVHNEPAIPKGQCDCGDRDNEL